MIARTRILLALLGLVVVPLGIVALLGARLVGREERLVRQSFADLALAQLEDLSQGVRSVVAEREARALQAPPLPARNGEERETLRRFVRSEPFFRAAIVLDSRGRIVFPPSAADRSAQETAFLLRARSILLDPGVLLSAAAPPSESESAGSPAPYRSRAPVPSTATVAGHGWHVWYDGSDIDLLLWQRAAGDRILGLEVDRARLLADVIARLPESAAPERSFALLDARGEILHRWGGFMPHADATPIARLALAAPLSAWQLVVHAPAQTLGGLRAGLWSGFGLGLAALALALCGLAAFLYREHTRGLRLAEQRVSFVNRVSHELKTPLTNIRLYAELLEERLDEDDQDARRQLAVVVAEGQRLGRLIDNVLTFGRHQRGALRLRAARGSVDTVVGRVLDRWRPALAQKGVRIESTAGAPGEVLMDADAVTQMLENLLGNAEKYAAAGGLVRVSTAQRAGQTTLVVADRGPGIPEGARERIFEPFERLHDRVSEGAAGTGIGLSVVRELARLHGGDAVVREGAPGAAFEITLATPLPPGGES